MLYDSLPLSSHPTWEDPTVKSFHRKFNLSPAAEMKAGSKMGGIQAEAIPVEIELPNSSNQVAAQLIALSDQHFQWILVYIRPSL